MMNLVQTRGVANVIGHLLIVMCLGTRPLTGVRVVVMQDIITMNASMPTQPGSTSTAVTIGSATKERRIKRGTSTLAFLSGMSLRTKPSTTWIAVTRTMSARPELIVWHAAMRL
jgi:hypothetical protein